MSMLVTGTDSVRDLQNNFRIAVWKMLERIQSQIVGSHSLLLLCLRENIETWHKLNNGRYTLSKALADASGAALAS